MDVLHAARQTVISGFLAMPLILIAVTAFFGLGLGNMGMTILFFGQAVLLPALVGILQFAITKLDPIDKSGLFVAPSDIGQLVPSAPLPATTSYAVAAPSYWMAHVLFFLFFVLINAIKVYMLESPAGENPAHVENRQSKAVGVMIVVVAAILVLPVLRYRVTGAETVSGIFIAAVAAAPLAYGVFELAAACGARHADMLSITQQMISQDAQKSRQYTCFQA